MICASLLSGLAIIVVGARLYARFFITRAPGLDDLLIVLALIFGVALSVLVMLGNQIYYNGYHVWDIPIKSAVPHRINIWVAQVCYTLALSFIKISILLFYKRLSVSFTKPFLIAVWVGIAYNIIYCIGFILLLCLLYRPLPAYWLSFDPVYYLKHDFKQGSEQLAEPLSAYFSVIGDLYSVVLPLVLISKLSLPRRQKYALNGLFSLGLLVVMFGSVRSYYMYRVVNVDWDFTWTLWKIWVWGEFEMWFGVYCASAPALKPFFKRWWSGLQTYRSNNRSGVSSSAKDRQVYVVRSDGRGGLGKVERHWVRNSARYFVPQQVGNYSEISSNRTAAQHNLDADGSVGILKSVDVDIERCATGTSWLDTEPSRPVTLDVMNGNGKRI
jgi:hypothetical protein